MFKSCQAASLLPSMLPMAATTRQTPVKPPMMYHHWLLEIRLGIQEKNSVPTRASIQEMEPSATLMKSTGNGKIRCLLNVWCEIR